MQLLTESMQFGHEGIAGPALLHAKCIAAAVFWLHHDASVAHGLKLNA